MSRRRLPLVFLACAALAAIAAACGDESPKTVTARTASPAVSAQGAASNASPTLAGPASKYSLLRDDVAKGYITDIPGTFVLDAKSYGKTTIFDSPAAGEAKLTEWGYVGGFETGMTPEGRNTAILQGAFAINIESHLFKDEEGAKKAYAYFDARIKSSGAQQVKTDSVGNQSAAYTLIQGKFPSSNVDIAFHRVLFRRGNLVSVLLTIGAQPFMTVDPVYALAVVVDDKALARRDAIEPTPTSNYTPPANSVPRTVTPAATPQGR